MKYVAVAASAKLNRSVLGYIGRTHTSRVKILAPWAKGAQNGGEKSGCFCNGYNSLAFLCNVTDGDVFFCPSFILVTDRYETRAKNVNRCPLLNLNRKILTIFP